mgnify:CR=1 FL=1
MKRWKRILSLAMAAAAVTGMLAAPAQAAGTYEDFADKGEIQNTEAVAAMVTLGVISGKEDGSRFDPNGTVTRAEMAKMISVCLNGGKDPAVGSGVTAQFDDIRGSWAEGYIAYCTNLGIISGRGDGTFGPEDPVTGTVAAKMLLTALGYDSSLEGLTGAGWELNTDVLANRTGLYVGLEDIVPSADGLTRDEAARMLYNCVQAGEVSYEENSGESSGVLYARDQGSMLANRFGLLKVTGIAAANEKKRADAAYKTTQEGEGRVSVTAVSGFDGVPDGLKDNPVFPVALSDELLGEEIVLFVRFADNLAPSAEGAAVVGGPILVQDEA